MREQRAQQVTEPVRCPRLPPGRGLHRDVAGLQDRAAGLGRRGQQAMVLGGAQRPEAARRQVAGRPDAQVRAVHMRMRSLAELVQSRERGRGILGMPRPVGDGDGPEHHVPALRGVHELAPQPALRYHRVSVGGGQPDLGRIRALGPPQQLSHAGRPRGADVARPDPDHRGATGRGHRGRLVGTGVGDHQHMHRDLRCSRRVQQPAQAGGQQLLLVVRRHDHADRRNPPRCRHTRPVDWATETGTPSVRMYTSARKSGSAWLTRQARPGWAASTPCTSSPVRG